jgi:very-short-patch-repair endonuclease
MKVAYNQKLIPLARELRKKGTYAEVLLWTYLKKKQMNGYRFTRQKPIGEYIVDFYCGKLGLAIEIDGITHDDKIEYDRRRQKSIEKQGVKFLRFTDDEVKENTEAVLNIISRWIEENEEVRQ